MAVFVIAGPALAQPAASPPPCTPGIPCLEYEVDTDANKAKADFSDLRKTCDGDVMNQIHARAFLEAQREQMMNQTFIRKPDSILSYSCFDQLVGVAAKKIPPMFSESTKWSGMSVSMSVTGEPAGSYPATRTLNVNMNTGSIIPLIQGIALGPASNFTQSNFQHDYLGDTAGFAYQIPGSVAPIDNMLCTRMQEVWNVAKSQNFDADPFLTFEEIAAGDPRTLTGACNNQKITAAHIAVAANKAPPYPEYTYDQITDSDPKFDPESGDPLQMQSVRVDGIRHLNADNAKDYFDPKLKEFILDASDSDSDNCAPPVKTGLKLLVRSGSVGEYLNIEPQIEEYEDAVCPNPQCFYKKSGESGACISVNKAF